MSSVKSNLILNGLNTVTSVIFPVVTFPYAARVLLPEGIGVVNFLNSIVSYIVLLTSLGIPMYAVKEIAKYQDDKVYRDKITVEILILGSLLCALGYVIVWLLVAFIPQIHEQSALFYILSLSILFNVIGVNWFYQGIENFKFITIRAILIRTLSALALFIFVRKDSDLLIYGLIIVGSTVGNNFINFAHLRKHINLKYINFSDLKIFRHLKPALRVFILNLIVSLYIQLNSIMLGFLSGDDAVGYFTAGTKISHIGLTIISSIATVLLPRCSYLLKIGDSERFKSVINKSLDITLMMSMPMVLGLMLLATPLTLIFCGNEYADAIPILILNAPVVLLISLTNLMGIQILYPKDKVNIVIWSVSGGAIVNLIINFCLIPHYAGVGAAIATLIAELTVFLIQLIGGKGYYPFKVADIIKWKYILGTIVMGIIVYFSIMPVKTDIWKLIIGIGIGTISYTIFLILAKDSIILEMKSLAYSKIKHVR